MMFLAGLRGELLIRGRSFSVCTVTTRVRTTTSYNFSCSHEHCDAAGLVLGIGLVPLGAL